MKESLNLRVDNSKSVGTLEQSGANINNAELKRFDNDAEKQFELETKGYAISDSYYVSKFTPNDAKRAEKGAKAKEHLNNLISNSQEPANTQEKMLVDGYKAYKMGQFGKYLRENVINNTQDPATLGGTAFMMPSLAKMLGETYKIEAKYGTQADGKMYVMDDYISAKTNESFSFAPELAYILQRTPNIFTTYEDVLNQKSNLPGSQAPSNDLNNYDYDFEARSIKTFSLSTTIQYNLLQQAALQGYYGLDQLAMKMERAQQFCDEAYYLNGMYTMFKNNRVMQTEMAYRQSAVVLDNTSLLKKSGMVGSDGKLAYNFNEIASSNNASLIQQFCCAFRFYKESRYGNQTMVDPVLVLPLYTFDLWDTTSFVNNVNLNRFVGVATFKEYFEKVTGIKVMPLNLLDPDFADVFGSLSLSVEDGQIGYFYDRSQFICITTRSFKSLSSVNGGWGTANNVDFTQVFEGEMTDVFNPYYNPNMASQNIPAIKFVLMETAE